jgi:hypothetical protein
MRAQHAIAVTPQRRLRRNGVFGGPIATPTMRLSAETGLRYSISTRRRSARPRARASSRDATPRATTWPASPRAPPASRGFSARIPFEDRHDRRGAQRARLEHVRDRQVAPDACRRGRPGRPAGCSAAGSNAATASSAARRASGIRTSYTTRRRLARTATTSRGTSRTRRRVHSRLEGGGTREALVRASWSSATSRTPATQRSDAVPRARVAGAVAQAGQPGTVGCTPRRRRASGPSNGARRRPRVCESGRAGGADGAPRWAGASGRKPARTVRGDEVLDTSRDLRRRRKSAVGASVAEPRVGHARERSVG